LPIVTFAMFGSAMIPSLSFKFAALAVAAASARALPEAHKFATDFSGAGFPVAW